MFALTRTTHGSPAHQKSGTPLPWRGARLTNGRQRPSVIIDVPEHPATNLTQRCISLTRSRCSSVRLGKFCGVMRPAFWAARRTANDLQHSSLTEICPKGRTGSPGGKRVAARHLERVSIPVGGNESAEELGCAPCDRRCLFFLAQKKSQVDRGEGRE